MICKLCNKKIEYKTYLRANQIITYSYICVHDEKYSLFLDLKINMNKEFLLKDYLYPFILNKKVCVLRGDCKNNITALSITKMILNELKGVTFPWLKTIISCDFYDVQDNDNSFNNLIRKLIKLSNYV